MIFNDDKQYSEADLQLMKEVDENSAGPAGMSELDQLEKRFGPKQPFLVAWEGFRKRWAMPLSYVCNLISAIGLFYVFKVLFEIIPIVAIGIFLSLVGVAAYEYGKRKASDKMWDTWYVNKVINFPALSLNAILFIASLLGTVYGAYWFITDNSPEAKFIGLSDDPEATAIQSQILKLREDLVVKQDDLDRWTENNAVRHGRDKGQMRYGQYGTEEKKTAAVLALEEQIASKEALLESQFGIITVQNEEIKGVWEMRNDTRIISGIIICIVFEIFFEILMAFMSKWDARRRAFLKKREKRGGHHRGQETNEIIREYQRQMEAMHTQLAQLTKQLNDTSSTQEAGKNGQLV